MQITQNLSHVQLNIGSSFALISFEGSELQLDNIFVEKDKRGQGIGQQLLNASIDFAKKYNKNLGLYAYAQDDNTDLDRLAKWYTDNGFTMDDEQGDDGYLMTYYI